MSESTTPPADVSAVRDHIENASVCLAWWHSADAKPADRVRAGHEAVDAIDAALRALHTARAALLAEIRRDEIDRAARVDELLAAVRAERFGYRREDPECDPAPDRPHDTFPVGGRQGAGEE